METIITVLQQIFLGKEDTNSRVGLSEFKQVKEPVKNITLPKHTPKELRISELMRRESCPKS